MKIAIIGSGMMGSALSFPAIYNGNQVALIGTVLDDDIITECKRTNKHPKFEKAFPNTNVTYHYFSEWKEAVKGASFIICGVSSFGVDWFLENVLLDSACNVPVLSVTKGLICLESGKLISYPDYWNIELAKKGVKKEICAIGGPCTSYELVFGDKTEVAFCGENVNTLKMMKKALQTPFYNVSLTKDIIGLESAVALKNGYALGVALTIGLVEKEFGENAGLHYNSQAGVFYQASKEMKKLMQMQKGSENAYFIGVGDLYVTVYGGRTRLVGILLGKGLTITEALNKLKGVTLESLVVAKRVAKAIKIKAEKGEIDINDFPLLMHVDNIISNGANAEIPWNKFTFEDL